MLRWRNWGLKYVGVQDKAVKLCPAQDFPFKHESANTDLHEMVISTKDVGTAADPAMTCE